MSGQQSHNASFPLVKISTKGTVNGATPYKFKNITLNDPGKTPFLKYNSTVTGWGSEIEHHITHLPPILGITS